MIEEFAVLPARVESCAIAESKPTAWSQAVALVHPRVLSQWSVLSHSRITLGLGRTRISAWLLADDSIGVECVVLSRRARKMLGAKTGDLATIEIPERVTLKVVPALVDDLPGPEEVDVNASIASHLADANGMAMLITEAAVVPVRLRPRSVAATNIRMSMLTRVLAGLAALPDGAETTSGSARITSSVQLSSLGRWIPAPSPRSTTREWKLVLRAAAGRARRASRLVSFCFEIVLRAFLRAPMVALRTTEALVGDDANHVVRIAAPVMPLIGVKPGEQVIVTWERRHALATVLESIRLDPEEQSVLRELRRVDVPTVDRQAAALHHLTISIPAELRSHLGMPRRTIVTVRRRLAPVFVGRLNELTIPVGGLLLAAATIQGLPIRDIAVGIAVVTVLAMLPLRHRTPPRGRWL